MNTIIGAALTLFTFVILVLLPKGFAVETPPENLVRVVYFLPNDRQPQPGINAKLVALIKRYCNLMRR